MAEGPSDIRLLAPGNPLDLGAQGGQVGTRMGPQTPETPHLAPRPLPIRGALLEGTGSLSHRFLAGRTLLPEAVEKVLA